MPFHDPVRPVFVSDFHGCFFGQAFINFRTDQIVKRGQPNLPFMVEKGQIFGMAVHIADKVIKKGPFQQKLNIFYRVGGIFPDYFKTCREPRPAFGLVFQFMGEPHGLTEILLVETDG